MQIHGLRGTSSKSVDTATSYYRTAGNACFTRFFCGSGYMQHCYHNCYNRYLAARRNTPAMVGVAYGTGTRRPMMATQTDNKKIRTPAENGRKEKNDKNHQREKVLYAPRSNCTRLCVAQR